MTITYYIHGNENKEDYKKINITYGPLFVLIPRTEQIIIIFSLSSISGGILRNVQNIHLYIRVHRTNLKSRTTTRNNNATLLSMLLSI